MKILILHPEGNVKNNPSLYALVCSLRDAKIDFDITIDKSITTVREKDVEFVKLNKFFVKLKKLLIDCVGYKSLLKILFLLKGRSLKGKYDLILGIDREGLVEAWIISELINIPYAFFSFEVIFEKETSGRYKRVEKKASSNIDFCIIQDKLRGALIEKENGVHKEKIFYLPLAGRGMPKNKKEQRVRDLIGIPKSKKIVVFIGSLKKWTMFDDIIRNIVYWPDDWVLLVHSRYGDTLNEVSQFIDINNLIKNKIYFSDFAFETNDDLCSLFDGVDFGMAMYRPDYSSKVLGLNLENIGMSSGKISTFLRYDIPVIINELKGWCEIVVEKKLGTVVNKVSEISVFLKNAKPEIYKGNCKEYFFEYLDYEIYEKELLEKFEK